MRQIELSYDTDFSGVPIIPEDLEKSYRSVLLNDKKLNPEGNRIAEDRANEVYELWEANGFRKVEIDPRANRDEVMACHVNSDIFFPEHPDEMDDVDEMDDIQYQIYENLYRMKVGKAAQICAECPLRAQCLASSTTLEAITRNKTVYVGYAYSHEDGMWGGYGPSARARISNLITERFEREHGEVDPSLFPHKNSNEGYRPTNKRKVDKSSYLSNGKRDAA